MERIAVLTGDIVGSGSIRYDALSSGINLISRLWMPDQGFEGAKTPISHNEPARIIGFSRRAGDGWQLAISTPQKALRVALAIRALCHTQALETRIAIAVGDHLDAILQTDLNAEYSEPFVHSGRLLETLGKTSWMGFANDPKLDAATRLFDHISQDWTAPQSAALYHALNPSKRTGEDIARALGKSRQAVGQALHAAGYPAIKAALERIEALPEGENRHD